MHETLFRTQARTQARTHARTHARKHVRARPLTRALVKIWGITGTQHDIPSHTSHTVIELIGMAQLLILPHRIMLPEMGPGVGWGGWGCGESGKGP